MREYSRYILYIYIYIYRVVSWVLETGIQRIDTFKPPHTSYILDALWTNSNLILTGGRDYKLISTDIREGSSTHLIAIDSAIRKLFYQDELSNYLLIGKNVVYIIYI